MGAKFRCPLQAKTDIGSLTSFVFQGRHTVSQAGRVKQGSAVVYPCKSISRHNNMGLRLSPTVGQGKARRAKSNNIEPPFRVPPLPQKKLQGEPPAKEGENPPEGGVHGWLLPKKQQRHPIDRVVHPFLVCARHKNMAWLELLGAINTGVSSAERENCCCKGCASSNCKDPFAFQTERRAREETANIIRVYRLQPCDQNVANRY